MNNSPTGFNNAIDTGEKIGLSHTLEKITNLDQQSMLSYLSSTSPGFDKLYDNVVKIISQRFPQAHTQYNQYLQKNSNKELNNIEPQGRRVALLQSMINVIKPQSSLAVDGDLGSQTMALLKSMGKSPREVLYFIQLQFKEAIDKQSSSKIETTTNINQKPSIDQLVATGVSYQSKESFMLMLTVQDIIKQIAMISPKSQLVDLNKSLGTASDGFIGPGTRKNMIQILTAYQKKVTNYISTSSNDSDINQQDQLNIATLVKLYRTLTGDITGKTLLLPVKSIDSRIAEITNNLKGNEKTYKNTLIALNRGRVIEKMMDPQSQINKKLLITMKLAGEKKLTTDQLKEFMLSVKQSVNKDPSVKIDLPDLDMHIKAIESIIRNRGIKSIDKQLLVITLLCEAGLAGDASGSGEFFPTLLTNVKLLFGDELVKDVSQNTVSLGVFQIQMIAAYHAVEKHENGRQLTRSQCKERIEDPVKAGVIAHYIIQDKATLVQRNNNLLRP